MYLEIFLADFAVFRVFLGISQDFAEIPEFRGSATARNIRSPERKTKFVQVYCLPTRKGRRCSHRENNHRMPESDDQILPTKKKENIMGGRMSLHCSRSQT